MSAAAAWLILAGDGLGQGQSDGFAAPQSPPSKVGSVPVRFDRQEIRTSAEPGVGVVDLCYEFTNTGELPLVVEEFAHSCGCMRGAWDGVPVQPGARGKINAKFLTNGLRGTIRKSLHVKFVEAGVVELIGQVIIPEALTYSAQTLRWVIGETARSKQVDIAISSRVPLRVLSVCGNDPAFACDLCGSPSTTYASPGYWTDPEGVTNSCNCMIIIFVGHNSDVPQGNIIDSDCSASIVIACGNLGVDEGETNPAAPTSVPNAPKPFTGITINELDVQKAIKDAVNASKLHAQNTICKNKECCCKWVTIVVRYVSDFQTDILPGRKDTVEGTYPVECK